MLHQPTMYMEDILSQYILPTPANVITYHHEDRVCVPVSVVLHGYLDQCF